MWVDVDVLAAVVVGWEKRGKKVMWKMCVQL